MASFRLNAFILKLYGTIYLYLRALARARVCVCVCVYVCKNLLYIKRIDVFKPVVSKRFWAMPHFGIFKILMLPAPTVILNSFIFIYFISKQACPIKILSHQTGGPCASLGDY